MLGGLYAVRAGWRAAACSHPADRRLVTVLESTVLRNIRRSTSLKSGARYLLIGGGNNGGVSTLGELPAEDVETVAAEQRNALRRRNARRLRTS